MAPLKGEQNVPTAFSPELGGSPLMASMKKKVDGLMKGGKKGREWTVDYDPYKDPDWYN